MEGGVEGGDGGVEGGMGGRSRGMSGVGRGREALSNMLNMIPESVIPPASVESFCSTFSDEFFMTSNSFGLQWSRQPSSQAELN